MTTYPYREWTPEPEYDDTNLALCAGYGGLDLAVEAAFGVTTVAVSEVDPGACKILEYRYPDAVNLGDMTTVDWSGLVGQGRPLRKRPRVVSGGTPCQDLSHAGARKGMTEGTRSNLWVAMREAVAQLRPAYVVWENVRGAFSAEADSDLEYCSGCMGDRRPGVVLRALGRVLGDLSDLGYDCEWRGLRAADVGAPHGRFRVFIVATRRDVAAADPRGEALRLGTGLREGEPGGVGWGRPDDDGPSGAAADTRSRLGVAQPGERGGPGEAASGGQAGLSGGRGTSRAAAAADTDRGAVVGWADLEVGGPDRGAVAPGDRPGLAAAADADDAGRGEHGGSVAVRQELATAQRDGDAVPDPSSVGRGEGRTESAGVVGGPDVAVGGGAAAPHADVAELPRESDERSGRGPAAGRGRAAAAHSGDRPGLGERACPEPGDGGQDVADADELGREGVETVDGEDRGLGVEPGGDVDGRGQVDWGDYRPAIERWERTIGRPAPSPTEPGRNGQPRLNPAFVEWMMGLEAGWVTDVPALTRNQMLHALGNGVVPQQAYAAIVDTFRGVA